MHELQKAYVWIVLLAIMGTAALNGTKLITTVWGVWQVESGQRGEDVPNPSQSNLAFNFLHP